MAVGLAVAGSAWYSPRALDRLDAASDASAIVARLLHDDDLAARAAYQGGSEPQRVRVRRVAEGDTIRSIAAEYSVSISTILASNQIDNPDLIVAGQELLIPPVEGVIAEVEQGETLAQVAARFNADMTEIAQANGLPVEPDLEIPYERLLVPGTEPAERAAWQPHRGGRSVLASARASEGGSPRASNISYEVQEGDTLNQLSAQFGVSVWTILMANNMSDPDVLKPGAVLKVPGVNGIEHEVLSGESLVDIAAYYEVDLGPIIDFNGLNDPKDIRIGDKITIPGAERPQPVARVSTPLGPLGAWIGAPSAPPQPARAPVTSAAAQQARQAPAQAAAPARTAAAAPAPAPRPAPAAPVARPSAPATTAQAAPARPAAVVASTGGSGGGIAANAMRFLGSRYVFGGTSPGGFDCSGFVWYVHQAAGKPVSRGLWGQMNGGPRVSMAQLQPGDTVFFANTYMPGLSHTGIYIGGGRFVHASDEQSGVKISSLGDSYWGPRYVGASRLW